MSKLIVEMEMPCACPCNLAEDNNGWYGPCFAYQGIPARDKEFEQCIEHGKRPDWCPICGVLPDEHGDLIDRDAFIHKYLAFYTEQERKKNLVFAAVEVKQQFADMICDERALIAAERTDDEQIH